MIRTGGREKRKVKEKTEGRFLRASASTPAWSTYDPNENEARDPSRMFGMNR